MHHPALLTPVALICLGAAAGYFLGGVRVGELGGTVKNNRLEVTFADGDNNRELRWFECKAVEEGSGAVVGCDVTRTRGNIYKVKSDVLPVGGRWRTRLTLSHLGEDGGFPEKKEIETQYHGVRYKPFKAIPYRENIKKCIPHFFKGGGGWVGCGTPFGVDLEECLKNTKLIIMGDSHMRSWVNATAGGGRNLGMHREAQLRPVDFGAVQYLRVESLVFTDKKQSSSIPEGYREGSTHTDLQIRNLATLLKKKEKKTTVVVNFGAWDLRDVTVDVYVKRVEDFFEKLETAGVYKNDESAKFIWRATSPYTYNSKKFRRTDYRTNEKIAAANSRVKKVLPTNWDYHDTYTLIHPVFEASCDSHHYLCNPTDTRVTSTGCPWYNSTGHPISVGCPGKADLSEFLKTHHCPSAVPEPNPPVKHPISREKILNSDKKQSRVSYVRHPGWLLCVGVGVLVVAVVGTVRRSVPSHGE